MYKIFEVFWSEVKFLAFYALPSYRVVQSIPAKKEKEYGIWKKTFFVFYIGNAVLYF